MRLLDQRLDAPHSPGARRPIAALSLLILLLGLNVGLGVFVRRPIRETGPSSPALAAVRPAGEAAPAGAGTRHPLDPLTEAELQLAARVVRAAPGLPEGALFPTIALHEPPKEEVLAFVPGSAFRREAIVVVLDRPRNRTSEFIVDLNRGRVSRRRELPGVQPLVLVEEYERYTEIVKADPRWQAAMRKRGITDFDRVAVEAWAPGRLLLPGGEAGEARLMRGVCYLKEDANNYYGRPIEGVVPTVDMNAGKLIELIDTGAVPIPSTTQELDPASIGEQRADLKPLVISQPQGPSFEVRGNEVRWQRWRFRFGMHPREGLVLYTVAYEDQGRPRSILYRASMSEMVVPYGDPDRTWAWRNALDEGEYGLGKLASSVEKDAPPNTRFFDATFADEFGKPSTRPRRIGLYERDGGVLWRHTDADGNDEVRRARDLVLFSVATIGNYDYLFHWIFRQDGSLELEVGATGIMLPKAVSDGTRAHGSGHRVAPGIVAPHHQHFFNVRLDLDIDGTENTASELDTRSLPAGHMNPYANVMRSEERLLRSESEARRDLNPERSRRWKLVNPTLRNALGEPPGYCLIPGENAVPYALPSSVIRRRAGFIDHHVWVTRYHPDERHAAGEHPNQSRGGEGLPLWSGNREPIQDQDVVVWYTMGLTHLPRPEEWPVMPVHRIGFRLLPAGFFERNPALDVPPP